MFLIYIGSVIKHIKDKTMPYFLRAKVAQQPWLYAFCTFSGLIFFYLFLTTSALALSESESAITFRGNQQSLNLPALTVHLQTAAPLSIAEAQKVLQSSLQGITKIVPTSINAHLRLHVQKNASNTEVKISSPTYPSVDKVYSLPKDAQILRQSLLGFAQFMGVQNLQGSTPFSGIQWNVHVFTPAQANDAQALQVQNTFWKPVRTLTNTGEKSSIPYEEKVLLGFSFNNTSQENVYAYILNITDTGQILPILAPQAQQNMQNILLAGKKHNVNDVYLELSAKVESVRLIISRVPLSFSSWQQEDFHNPTVNFMQASQSPKNDVWTSWEIKFVKK